MRVSRYHGGPSQQWRLATGKDGNLPMVANSGRALDLPGGSDRDRVREQSYEVAARRSGDFGNGRRRGHSPGTVQVVPCSSGDSRRRHCQVHTSGGVRRTRQVSGSPCRKGGTRGYDGI